MNKQNQPPTPSPVKRLLRQEAGFGCCVCGNPIIQYHHIIPWESEQHFRPEDMMCLCPNHHDEANKKAMLEKEQRKHKTNPFNIQKGITKGNLKVNYRIPVIDTGGFQFVGEEDFIIVDKESLVSLKINDGQLELTIKLYNDKDELIAHIKNNEWITGDPSPWDLESNYQMLKIRHKMKDIALDINTKKIPIILRANLWRKGSNFRLTDKGVIYNGVVKNTRFLHLCIVGTRFVVDISKKTFELQPDPRFKTGFIVSWPILEERIQKGLEAWEDLIKLP